MRLITLNVNGIRAAERKGFYKWAEKQNADFICVQELKAQFPVLEESHLQLDGYDSYFFPAEKKGYSGVGIFSRHKPDSVIEGLGFQTADTEGRYIQLEFPNLSIVSLYLPSGTSGDERQTLKYDFLDRYAEHLSHQLKEGKEVIIAGDWNIAHKKIDIKNWRGNQKNSGFLPEERAWMDQLFNEIGYVDAFRVINQEEDQYTWWSNRGRAWDNNVGWRIDYQVVSPGLRDKITNVSIYKDERFSDHSPLIVDYNL